MTNQSPKMSRIFTAFSAWAGRGLRVAKPEPATPDDVQEFEGHIAPVIPQAKLPLTVHGERRPN
jgi:hypothetical protein